MSRRFLSPSARPLIRAWTCAWALGLYVGSSALAQSGSSEVEQIAKAHDFVINRNWSKAETLLLPVTKSQPKNPFIFYDLAQVYENTNRVELAKQIYQGLTNTLGTDPNQYTIVVRAPYASRLVSLVSQAQAKLNAINAQQATLHVVASIPPPPMVTATVMTNAPTKQVANTATTATLRDNKTTVNAAMRNWAMAWANKDLANYYASYVPSFRGEMPTRAAWENKRREQISRESNIEINFRNLEMTSLSPTSVQARFMQSYFSDTQSSKARKTLLFTLTNGRWLIEHESSK